jgi:hypothetical protein
MQGSHRQGIGRLAAGTRLDDGFGAIRQIAGGVDHCALTLELPIEARPPQSSGRPLPDA